MHKKLLYTNKYKQPVYALYQEPYNQQPQPANNMVQFQKYQQTGDNVNQTLEYLPNFPRTKGVEFGPGRFTEEQYQNAITRDSTELNNYIQDNPISSYFMGSNQGHASSAGSLSGNIQLNREWLHRLKGFDNAQSQNAANQLNVYPSNTQDELRDYQQPSPGNYIRKDENKYMQYKQPTLRYQDTTIDYSNATMSGVDNSAASGPMSPAGDQFGGGGGGSTMGNASAYASLAGQLANGMKDPSAGANLNPNMNLQTQGNTKVDESINLNTDDAISFSDQFKGNSVSPNQISENDFKSIVDGQVPADKGTAGHLASGAGMAATGAMVGGPVGAIVGFAVGTGMSMFGDKKNEDARSAIKENLVTQNSSNFALGTNQQRTNNDNELARFLV